MTSVPNTAHPDLHLRERTAAIPGGELWYWDTGGDEPPVDARQVIDDWLAAHL